MSKKKLGGYAWKLPKKADSGEPGPLPKEVIDYLSGISGKSDDDTDRDDDKPKTMAKRKRSPQSSSDSDSPSPNSEKGTTRAYSIDSLIFVCVFFCQLVFNTFVCMKRGSDS